MNRRPVISIALLSGLLTMPAYTAPAIPAGPAVTGATTRVSVATSGAQANSISEGGTISQNGRYVAFDSDANLVTGDTNGSSDVYVRDRNTGTTNRVSIATSGTQGNDSSGGDAISADGRYVSFTSGASNLVAGDTNVAWDVFVRDRDTGTTTRVSIATGGTQANGHSLRTTISADGRYIAFTSGASNLVAGDTNGVDDVFVHDRDTGATTRVDVATGGSQANDFSDGGLAISGDGRYVAFSSYASNLVTGDTNNRADVFVRDRDTRATTRVSIATSGTQGNDDSRTGTISSDGRYVAFDSDASNLVAGDTNGRLDVFVRDRDTGATTRVSVATNGTQGSVDRSGGAISADGRYVAFGDRASIEEVSRWDVFVRDRVTGVTTLVSVATSGARGNNYSTGPTISADGRYVAFYSDATNLVAGDTNGTEDVFVRDRLAAVPATPVGDFNGNGWSDLIARQTSTGYLWLYRGNGALLTARVRIGTGWNAMSAITRFGDFNRDGHEDVIARDRAGVLWLYPGTGTGFASRVRIGSGGWNGMREITPVGDLTRDGYPDLLAVETSTGRLYLYPGRGTSFQARRLIGTGWNSMSELAGVGDFNKDGRVDLVARQSATGTLWFYPGTTGALGARTRIGTGWNTMRDLVGIGDFDRDGFTDLFAVQNATGRLLMYPGRGTRFGASLQIGTGWSTSYRPLS